MALGQGFFEFISVRFGIARDVAIALEERFARARRGTQRIDARAEIENLTGFDAGALRPALDIAAVGSID